MYIRYLRILVLCVPLLLPSRPEASCVTLTWTSPQDDGRSGCAYKYEVRYATFPISETTWASATLAKNPPVPSASGEAEFYTISDLTPGVLYFFGIKSADDCDNWSELSNLTWGAPPEDECYGSVGNANCDPYDENTIGDISALIGYLFLDGTLCCPREANINGDPAGALTIGDVSAYIEHLFQDGPPLPLCQ